MAARLGSRRKSADVGGRTVHARMSPATKVDIGGTLDVYFDMGKMHLFDPDSAEALV